MVSTEEHIMHKNEYDKQNPPVEKKNSKKKRTCDVDDADIKINEAFAIMKSISEKKPAVSYEYSPFATYIDSKLKIFSPHEKAILENQIQNLIFNAEMKHYTQPVHTQPGQPFYFQNAHTQIPSNYNPHNSLNVQYSHPNMPLTHLAENLHNTSNQQQLQSLFTHPEQNSLCGTDAFQTLPHTNLKNMALTTNLEALRCANHDFSFSLYKEVAKTETGNIFYSPFSIHVIMFMASTGAASKTFDEMVATLHLNETTHSLEAYGKLLEELTSKTDSLKLATGMFVDTAFNVKDSFVENSKKYLKSSIENLNFKNDPEQQRQYLNNWVLNETNNKIKDVFPKDSINKDTALVLANAVHFKSSWAQQFKHVYDGSFYVTPSDKVPVKMMYLERDFQYYHDSVLNFTAIEIPYKNHAFKMIILLPDVKDGLKNLENNISTFKLHDISKKMTQHYISVRLPRFKIEQSLQLDETLSNLGCPTMFSQAANFSNIVEDGKLNVSKVLHKAYIDVDEYGTEAAAVTTAIQYQQQCVMSFKDVNIDHPFMFFISTRCNSIIFVGRMTKID